MTLAKGCFSKRTGNALNAVFGDALTLEELAAMPDCDLRRWRRIGDKALAEIRDVCAKKLGGLSNGRTPDFDSGSGGSNPSPRSIQTLTSGEAIALLSEPGDDVRVTRNDADEIVAMLKNYEKTARNR